MYRCNLICSRSSLPVLTALDGMLAYQPWETWTMTQMVDDVAATLQQGATWRKSSHSNPNGNCVELTELAGGKIAIRNSRHARGPVQIYACVQIAAFVQRAKNGEFDLTFGRSRHR
jgi:Domain of unknown function (DUF397)